MSRSWLAAAAVSRSWLAATAMTLAVLGGGCSAVLPVRTVDQPMPPPAAVHVGWPGCRNVVSDLDLVEYNDRVDQGRVPDDFVPVRAVQCQQDWTSGDVRRGLERQTTTIASLVDLLARPGQEQARISGEVTCSADAWLPPWLFLVDGQGRWMTPQIPLDVCGKPLELDVVDTSGWSVVGSWALDPAALAAPEHAGCQARFNDQQLLEPSVLPAAAIPETMLAGPARAVCRFSVAAVRNRQIRLDAHFVSGRRPSSADAPRIEAALESPPAAACNQPRTSFAVVFGPANETFVVVELDGCRRVLNDRDGVLRAGQASAALLELLER